MCGRHGAGFDCPEKKQTNLVVINVLLIFGAKYYKDLIRAMLPIYYGTSSSIFCQISDLKEKFEKINKHQTALKLEF